MAVSWIRHRDLHILSVGAVTYTSDDRFQVVPDQTTGDWAMRLMYARPRDSGQYDCQVSATPAYGRTFHLEVVVVNYKPAARMFRSNLALAFVSEPQAEVLRAPEMHVGVGSLINLTCVVPYSPETPEYLHWYHKERMVREDGQRVWMRTTLGHKSISQLVVKDARPSDSGLYTCSPAHSREHSITVHVLTGQNASQKTHV
ncbi:hypothetical protein HAZT_HAZT003350 [Hyalella azteca]|uniref:Ig-like domain-containing protein n=1 Tax=Hyalella azteca TaxID=294128 RepID=A0A6A0H7I3_HYAAZ|nr:hypothetical protein HAZT_HAZT003350 [Hyalella azteca]